MARCEEGYLCHVCGQEVEHLWESELYLRYVLGWVRPEQLHQEPECHLRCNPALAQFVVDEEFPPVEAPGPFDKRGLDPEFVRQREQLVTRAWRRLRQLASSPRPVPITEYPLPEVLARWTADQGGKSVG